VRGRRLGEVIEGYRWLWRAQRRWSPGPVWLSSIRFAVSVIADIARAVLPTPVAGRVISGTVAAAMLAAVVSVGSDGQPFGDDELVAAGFAQVTPRRMMAEPGMTVDITLWPYERSSPSGVVLLPTGTCLWVLPNYNGGAALGGDDRLTIVLSDTTYHENGAVAFWPVIAKMPLAEAQGLHAELERVIGATRNGPTEPTGMESMVGTAIYSLDGGSHVRLPAEATWRVLPRYVGVDVEGNRRADERVTLVLSDTQNGFWPVIVKMDSGIARSFMADLGAVINQKRQEGAS
jgi:hypothetical protein